MVVGVTGLEPATSITPRVGSVNPTSSALSTFFFLGLAQI
jgi:hypothetical protein